MKLIVPKGMKITCENGHYIGEDHLKDVREGDMGWGDSFGNWASGVDIQVGQTEQPFCPECGAKFADRAWSFHYEDGAWRP